MKSKNTSVNLCANPILPGDFPDPSIVRVAEDYYLVNSTFQYFPGIIISHSRDLVHWETIGHVLTRKSQLDLTNVGDSAGIWAPDISYHAGRFWVAYTRQTPKAGLNCLVYAAKPEGPYSDPFVLNDVGIDPSIFTDDDGARYFTVSSGSTGQRLMYRLKPDGSSFVGDAMVLWAGTGRHCPEGPHVFKNRGYYYMILAEGGTGYGHCETCARARNIEGPYESSPYNPILQPVSPEHPIRKTGHGKPVQTQNGEWWFVYLGGRPDGGRHCNLGRETFLGRINWTADDWFAVEQPAMELTRPNLPLHVFPAVEGNELASQPALKEWEFVRNPSADTWVRDPADTLTLSGAVFARRQKHFNCRAAAVVANGPPSHGRKGGLTVYADSANHIRLFRTDRGYTLAVVRNNICEEHARPQPCGNNDLLRVEICGQNYHFAASVKGKDWQAVGPVIDGRFLSPESICATKRKCFTGVRIGLFDEGPAGAGTRFTSFSYDALPG